MSGMFEEMPVKSIYGPAGWRRARATLNPIWLQWAADDWRRGGTRRQYRGTTRLV
jgi:hypothetical protein